MFTKCKSCQDSRLCNIKPCKELAEYRKKENKRRLDGWAMLGKPILKQAQGWKA